MRKKNRTIKVMYIVTEALLGGHVLSGFTIAKKMKEHGIEPIFVGAKGVLSKEIEVEMPFEVVDIPLFHGTRHTYITWSSIKAIQRLSEISRNYSVDLIHAFDARSYLHAYPAGLIGDIPITCTLCGGIDPYYNIPQAPEIMVFSEEQKHRMTNHFNWPKNRVNVVRTRLDLQQIRSDVHFLNDEESKRFGISPSLPKVMMISSFDGTKIRSIHQVLDAVEILFLKGVKFQLVLIGGKGELYDQARLKGESLCKRFEPDCVVFTGPVLHAFRLLQRATVVLGVGRSAFEGMIYSKPTLIVGENGFAGIVAPETVDDIGWYNFSGRNQQKVVSAENLATEISLLLADEVRCCELGEFAFEFIRQEIDVAQGASSIKSIYKKLLVPESRLPRWKQWYSFVRCLVPIMIDNGMHTIKQGIKRVVFFNRGLFFSSKNN